MDLTITLRNAEKILFEGKVKAVSSENENGAFDILPEHANFITIVKKKIIIHHLNGEKEVIELDNGIIKAEENHIHIFLGVNLI